MTFTQDDIGHVLEHTSTPPDYSDYVDVKEKGGDFDSHIVDYEGVNFDEQGVLDAIVQQVVSFPLFLGAVFL